jgi:hypothetical protein
VSDYWPGIDSAAGAGTVPRASTARAAAVVCLGVAALGVPYALLWRVLAPHIPVVKVDDGVVPADPAPEQLVAGDGWFAIIGAGIGAAAAVLAWWLARRHRGPLLLAALATGAVVAGVLASWLGQRIGLADYRQALAAAASGTPLSHPPDLRISETGRWFGVVPKATGVQLVAAFAAAVTYTLLAGWSKHPDLRPAAPGTDGPVPSPYWDPVSSDSWTPPAHPAEPARPGPGEAEPLRD